MGIARTIGKGAVWNTASTLVGKVVVLANIFMILQHLSVYEYGLSELVLSVISAMGIILLPGLSTAIVADLSYEKSKGDLARTKSIFWQYNILGLVLGVLAWAVLFFCAEPIAGLVHNPTIGYFLRIVSFTFLISPVRKIAIMLATVEMRFFDQSFYSVVEEIWKGIFLFTFFYIFGRTLDGLFLAIVLSQCIAFICYIPRSISAYASFGREKATRIFNFWEVMGKHRKWSIAGSYASSLTQTLQLWIIRLMLGTEAVGLYSVASGILSQVSALMPLGTILAPIVPQYVERKNELAKLLRASLKVQVGFAVLLFFGALLGLPIFVLIFPKYQQAMPLAMILLVSLVPLAVVNIFTPVFAAFKEQFSFLISTVVKLVLTALLFPVGILALGLWGVGVANTAVIALSAGERYWRLRRTIPEFTFQFKDFYSLRPEEQIYANTLMQQIKSSKYFPAFLRRS
jgi:O-antigen/teichoic acid export membrane protein